ncbi:MAG: DUF2158 domain-containing protein [Erythrobacter sp.]|uniref:YodC family protein n=1 Tax=Erythrobacter sp. TaxID=1042 RepID=UPI001B0CC9EC|nr:DUF2158 domain-containing protein [Erythrobacter sp.]MBO6767262.1 DUF2158 domain-containing protein [Erythrobacter sp.]
MTTTKFQVGDVVRLKSGGPLMTVQQSTYADNIMCVWLGEHNKRMTEGFHPRTLQKRRSGGRQ